MNPKDLKGYTITQVVVEESSIHDDDPSVVLYLSTGTKTTKIRIEGGFDSEAEGDFEGEYKQVLKFTHTKTIK